jgi:tetratricopeptide (TPR) repeat protein
MHTQNCCTLRAVIKALILTVILCASFGAGVAAAADPSIDRLLGKLPPPEKFVDPARNDPLARQMFAAAKAHNFGIALEASRRLANKYPRSLGAQAYHGLLAVALRRFPEASAAYRKALSIRSDFSPGYVGLALAEAAQKHFREALSDFQQITKVAPKADVGWIGSSACAEKLGMRQDSLAYARRATVVAPTSPGAWFQLAREEGLFGDKQAAGKALARANRLRGSSGQDRITRSPGVTRSPGGASGQTR